MAELGGSSQNVCVSSSELLRASLMLSIGVVVPGFIRRGVNVIGVILFSKWVLEKNLCVPWLKLRQVKPADRRMDINDQEMDAGDERMELNDQEVEAGDERMDKNDQEEDAGDRRMELNDKEVDAGDRRMDINDQEEDAGDHEMQLNDRSMTLNYQELVSSVFLMVLYNRIGAIMAEEEGLGLDW